MPKYYGIMNVHHIRGHTLYHNDCITVVNFLMTGLQGSQQVKYTLWN